MMDTLTSTEVTGTPDSRWSKLRAHLGILGWMLFAILLLVSFTVSKLPTQQIGQMLLAKLNQQLQAGMVPLEISAQKSTISLFPFPGVRLEETTLKSKDSSGNTLRVRLAELTLRASLIDLIVGRFGGSISIKTQQDRDPALKGAAWFKKGSASLALDFKDADIGEAGLGILPIATKLSGKFPLNGSIRFEGDLAALSSATGSLQINIGKVELPPQKFMAMDFPAISIADGEIKAKIQGGKFKVESLRLGKLGDVKDDLAGLLSGDITLGKSWDSSQMDFQIQLQLSPAVNQAAWLLGSLLSPFKKDERSFSFSLAGPSYAPLMGPPKGAGGG